MKKSMSLAIFVVGLLSLQCGLQASPAAAAFVDDARAFPLLDLSLAWVTVGAIAVVAGAFGLLFLRNR